MASYITDDGCLGWSLDRETVTVRPWGTNGFRVTARRGPAVAERDWALAHGPGTTDSGQGTDGDGIPYLINGRAKARISDKGLVSVIDAVTGSPAVEETARGFKSINGGAYKAHLDLRARDDERIYGLGQHQHGYLDQKGCVIELQQRNTEVSIPFLVSDRRYGFLWNNPALGRVELGRNRTRWVADATDAIDYWVTVGGSYAGILDSYCGVTGYPSAFPEWATGFWQSKLRYKDQAELLAVAREYRDRGLPLSVIVADYFHWTMMGDWRFNPVEWPDPEAMVKELGAMGVELMVSVWPTVNPNSPNFQVMRDSGFLVGTERGVQANTVFVDRSPEGHVFVSHYDATNPKARAFVWDRVKEGYHKYGIRLFWLDACEPELYPADSDNLRYHLGNGETVGNIFPLWNQRTFFDGLTGEGEGEPLLLTRSAWAGSQAFGALVWSGDIPSTFESLQRQVRAGLNMALSGMPWWTTDIGGFHGGDVNDPFFRELVVRWFQYGVFCPVFRLHGVRKPDSFMSGGPNEVWSFGDSAYAVIREYMLLRERLRPYVMEQMGTASRCGTPPMRPLFFDFPDDPGAYHAEDQFLFGSDVMVAPVLAKGQTVREVYMPADCTWEDAWTGTVYAGGYTVAVDAPVERIPVFIRNGNPIIKEFFGR